LLHHNPAHFEDGLMGKAWIIKAWIILGGAAVVVVAGYASGFFHYFALGFVESRRAVAEGHAGLPSCDTETGLANARNVINTIPNLKRLGITALGISNARNSAATASEVDCEAVVALSNSMKGPVHYSFVRDASVGGPFLVKANIDGARLEKF
jgi:hypothetical protein